MCVRAGEIVERRVGGQSGASPAYTSRTDMVTNPREEKVNTLVDLQSGSFHLPNGQRWEAYF